MPAPCHPRPAGHAVAAAAAACTLTVLRVLWSSSMHSATSALHMIFSGGSTLQIPQAGAACICHNQLQTLSDVECGLPLCAPRCSAAFAMLEHRRLFTDGCLAQIAEAARLIAATLHNCVWGRCISVAHGAPGAQARSRARACPNFLTSSMHDMLRGAERLVPRFSDRDRYTTGPFFGRGNELGLHSLKIICGLSLLWSTVAAAIKSAPLRSAMAPEQRMPPELTSTNTASMSLPVHLHPGSTVG